MDPQTALIIKTELALHGTNQAALARQLGLTEVTLSRLMLGKKAASPELVARIFHEIHRPIYERGGLLTPAGR